MLRKEVVWGVKKMIASKAGQKGALQTWESGGQFFFRTDEKNELPAKLAKVVKRRRCGPFGARNRNHYLHTICLFTPCLYTCGVSTTFGSSFTPQGTAGVSVAQPLLSNSLREYKKRCIR